MYINERFNTKGWCKIGAWPIDTLTYVSNKDKKGEQLLAIREKVSGITNTECDGEQAYDMRSDGNTIFSKIAFPFYGINGVTNVFLLTFDFKNEVFAINGRRYKVENDFEFTFKFLKTKVKAADGIKGLYEFFINQLATDSPFDIMLEDIFTRISK